MLFTEGDFLDRFAAAADHGFQAVELQFPYDHSPDSIARRLEEARLPLVLLNAPPGDPDRGERGLAAIPERASDFRISIAEARIYAQATGAAKVHVMAGRAASDSPTARAAYLDALRFALDALPDCEVLIEPLNPRDAPGYFLASFEVAAGIIAEIGSPRLKLQYDIYHRQILHGDVLTSLTALAPIVGHVQIASVPARAEPCSGELDDIRIFDRLDAQGYASFVGCEYRPARGTTAGLGWLDRYRKRRDGEVRLKSTWREKL
jgi:hydroxypyruvate isomerase